MHPYWKDLELVWAIGSLQALNLGKAVRRQPYVEEFLATQRHADLGVHGRQVLGGLNGALLHLTEKKKGETAREDEEMRNGRSQIFVFPTPQRELSWIGEVLKVCMMEVASQRLVPRQQATYTLPEIVEILPLFRV